MTRRYRWHRPKGVAKGTLELWDHASKPPETVARVERNPHSRWLPWHCLLHDGREGNAETYQSCKGAAQYLVETQS